MKILDIMLFYGSLCYVKRLFEARGLYKILCGASKKIEKKEKGRKLF